MTKQPSDDKPNGAGWMTSALTVIPDSYTDSEDGEDEDDIQLQQRLKAREMTKKKNAAPHHEWSHGNLVKPDGEVRFIDTKEMPMELMQLSIPVQYFQILYNSRYFRIHITPDYTLLFSVLLHKNGT
jgi:hypothetical protein